MVEVTSDDVSRALDTYLPELRSEETRDRLHRKLLHDLSNPDSVDDLEPEDFPRPAAYDPALDAKGQFEDYFRHHVSAWTDGFEAKVSASSQVAEGNTVFADFVESQSGRLAWLMTRTLLEVLYERRARGALEGDSPEERYASFRRWTNSAEGHVVLLAENPYLFRTARERVRTAASQLLHVLSEVERNRALLDERIPGVTAGSGVSTVVLGQGDTHNGGRAVARVVFDDGGQVVHKPRPMEAEAGYHAFVSWMNERLGTGLRTLAVLPCGEEGFVEYVRTGSGNSGTKEYFSQIGRLTGILYLLRAIDIHYENMVTSDRGPVVVDTETLLTPRMASRPVEGDGSGWRHAVRTLRESVVAIGVLPMVMGSNGSDTGIDVGVIGYDQGQRSPYRNIQFHHPGRDDMFAQLVHGVASDANANPSVSRTASLPVAEQRDILKRELRRVLVHARDHRQKVADAIDRFLGGARFRFLNNATIFYAQLLRMVTHPDALRDPLIRAAVLHRTVLSPDAVAEVGDDEARQLARGDVPYFTYTAASRDLAAADRTVLRGAFAESGLEATRARLAGLDTAEIERQLTLVDFSFVDKLPREAEPTGFAPRRPPGRAVPRTGRDRFLDEAVRIGDALVDGMITGTDESHPATWISPVVTGPEENQWTPGALGYDLYSGTPGIALVLAGLARETGAVRYRDAALRVIGPLETQLRDGVLAELRTSVGGMSGLSGTLYCLDTARRLLGTPGTMTAGETADLIVKAVGSEGPTDFLSGTTGALAVCMALHRHSTGEDDRERTAAAAAGIVALGSEAFGVDTGTGRATEYLGYAHGAAGIAPWLIEYGAVFGDEEIRDLGVRVMRAVADAYDESARDWPREWSGEETHRAYGWCHGAPGLLLGAASAVRHAPDAFPRDLLARLAELTLERGFGNNTTYCHGDLGSAESVLLAEQLVPGLFGEEVTADLYPRLFTDVLERYDARADSKYAFSNSLMLGQAGIAWSVLRHLDPETYPSVLRLF
ncbi:type 2 lanthipeptide synthetase LanM [Nocardiopsis sp. NPDC050513]|uniref:type 2 lanthipeptide synthetase LanM n=1 Tax=Nocardiopsis sp. NPDC050513 TaxID=3364338 RepID=UPI00378CFA1A